MYRVIVLNPGSTSTKVAFYEDDRQIFSENLSHPAEELGKFEKIVDQLPYRKKVILDMLEEKEIDLMNVDAFSAICTGLLPMPGGVFEVNEIMYEHGSYGPGSRHPGNLGPMLARDFAEETGARAFVVDPSSLDEMIPEARMTGFVELIRTERGHPLNQKAVGRKYASDTGKKYEELNLVIAHLLQEGLVYILHGGGIQVTEGGFVHGAKAANHTGKDMLFPAKSRQGFHHAHVIVQADHIMTAVLNELVHHY